LENRAEHAAKTTSLEQSETARLEAFSDGVFAVAITLLALDLRVPPAGIGGTPRALADALVQQWPSYLAFVTSFLTVLIMWLNHHLLFKLVRKTSTQLMFANGYLLMTTTAVPFATELVSAYLQRPAARVAAGAYGGTFVLISIGYLWVWRVVKQGNLFKASASAATIERINRNYRFGTPLYLLATLSAGISAYLTLGICTALWIFWALTATEC
jgi:uncharacterized membrane protein